jgi:hypothetical protein
MYVEDEGPGGSEGNGYAHQDTGLYFALARARSEAPTPIHGSVKVDFEDEGMGGSERVKSTTLAKLQEGLKF